jgi:hypothetical protein
MAEPPNNRDDMNIDYRILSLLLACATRSDLLREYANNDDTRLRAAGFPQELLNESRYVFQDEATQEALQQTEVAFQTLVNINDYCALECPSQDALKQVVAQASLIRAPLPVAGK